MPLATYLPWFLRPDGELDDFYGTFVPFARERAAELYESREAYLEAALRAVAAEVVGDREHRLELSNRSPKGTYCSLQLEVTVTSREEQRALFATLQKHEAVA